MEGSLREDPTPAVRKAEDLKGSFNTSIYLPELIIRILLMNLEPEASGNRQMFTGRKDKRCFFQTNHLVQVNDTVAIAADKLWVTQQKFRKVLKPHIGLYDPVSQMDLYVVIKVIGV